MTFRRTALINTYFFTILFLATIGITVLYYGSIAGNLRQNDDAFLMVNKVISLMLLTDNYLENHYERERDQWGIELQDIREILRTGYPRVAAVLTPRLDILERHFRLLEAEHQAKIVLLQKPQDAATVQELVLIGNLERTLEQQMELLSQEIIAHVFTVAADTNLRIRREQLSSGVFSAGSLLFVIILGLLGIVLTYRRIILPVGALTDAAVRIRNGEYGSFIRLEQFKTPPDEIVSLTRTFNDMAGRLDKQFQLLQDEVTERKRAESLLVASLAEKEVLLAEIHHRVKNNMQIIVSLLGLQEGKIRDDMDRELFVESRLRIRSMAMIHEMLYESANYTEIDFKEYVHELASTIAASYGRENIDVGIEAEEFYLEMTTAIPCAVILNELMTNSYKYAFPGGAEGAIVIRFRRHPARLNRAEIELEYTDSGAGLPDGFVLDRSDSLGMRLIQSLVEQLDGDAELGSGPGFRFTLSFNTSAT